MEKLTNIYDLDLFRLNAAKTPNPDNFTAIVFRAVTTLHIPSTNLKLNFPDALVIHVSLFYIIMPGALGETLVVYH